MKPEAMTKTILQENPRGKDLWEKHGSIASREM